MSDVTIVVINYKQDQYLAEAVQSAEDQCKPVAPSLRYAYSQMPSFKVQTFTDIAGRGASSARNIALTHVTSPYCIILDADDMLPSHYLWYLWNTVKELDYVLPLNKFVGPSVQFVSGLRKDRLFYDNPEEYNNATFENYCPCATISAMFPMEAYRKISGFDENMKALNDWDFFIRLSRSGISYRHCADTFILRRGDVPGSITRNGMSSEASVQAILKVFNDKHGTKLNMYPQGYTIPAR